MDKGIAKGDVTNSNGIGTDNMTCIIIRFKNLAAEMIPDSAGPTIATIE